MIGILDLNIGNISSVKRIIESAGFESFVIKERAQIFQFEKIILPGVGHFDEGVRQLNNLGFADALTGLVREKKITVMGICLGMQLLCRQSEEGDSPGLGLINADVMKFRFTEHFNLKVPHMGWSVVSSVRHNHLLPIGLDEQRFYFVHSYKVVPDDPAIIIGTANYGSEFCAVFQQDNIFGVQFHPEKSHRFGMDLMRRFAEF